MHNLAISLGDINGVGLEIALKSHNLIKTICNPIYCINDKLLNDGAKLLNMNIPDDFNIEFVDGNFEIEVGKVSASSGKFSYNSFIKAIELTKRGVAKAIITLPIHKEAWSLAGVPFKGHTDLLREIFKTDAIMMLGCPKMYVALFSEHVALRDVPNLIKKDSLVRFFLDFYNSLHLKEEVAVLGLNPHAGDNGVLGDEEQIIKSAIDEANSIINCDIFVGAIVPDIAFTPKMRKRFKYFIAMYHDSGLAPLKALYFDESINVTLNLPIIRTSVDHGVAFDIAYKNRANNLSYLNAINEAILRIKNV